MGRAKIPIKDDFRAVDCTLQI